MASAALESGRPAEVASAAAVRASAAPGAASITLEVLVSQPSATITSAQIHRVMTGS
jgi:hypothetical protein